MEGNRAYHADGLANWHWRRFVRACVLAMATLLGARAGNDCIAFNGPAAHGRVKATGQQSALVTPRNPVTILAPCDRGGVPLLAAAECGAHQPVDPCPPWFHHVDESGREATSEGGVAEMTTGTPIRYAAAIDDDWLCAHLPADEFVETGPGTMRLSMAGLDVDPERSVAGGRMQLVAADDDRGRLLLESRLSWLFEYLQTDGTAAAFFQPGDKSIFAVQGLGYGSNWAILGLGMRWELIDGWSAHAGYDAQGNRQQLFHIGSVGLSYAW